MRLIAHLQFAPFQFCNSPLKVPSFSQFLMCAGRLFHVFAATTLKLCSPYFDVRVLETCNHLPCLCEYLDLVSSPTDGADIRAKFLLEF